MKVKSVMTVLLALVMVFALAACGGGSDTGASAGNSTAGSSTSDESVVDDTVYTLSFSSSRPLGSTRNIQIEEVLKQKLEEKSNGRLTIQIYENNTLVAQKELLEGMAGGTVDMGYLVGTMYAGQFPYSELFGTPGLVYDGIEGTDKVLDEFMNAYPDPIYQDFKILVRYSIGQMGLVSVKPVKTIADIKGLSIRSTSSFVPFYEALGASTMNLSAGEVYEALKTGVIGATNTGLAGAGSNKLGEVANSFTPLPILYGDELLAMSIKAYNSLPPDLQAVVDEVGEEMKAVETAFTISEEEAAIKLMSDSNSDFAVYELSTADIAKLAEIAAPMLEAKAKELDAAGLDGTKALEWLREHSVKVN
ncbi:MAG: TRAP transporter substrate-binding protein DctP [Clostridiales Family XIII bacterium]|nr:TRAP transporter substrate-binding protein DctP [Clostridiales Family XIII bacterium]